MGKGVVFGLKCGELFASYDQDGFLLRMSQISLIKEDQEYCTTLPKQGMMQNGKLYQQEMLEQDTSEKDCGSSPTEKKYPTPCAGNWKDTVGTLKGRIGTPYEEGTIARVLYKDEILNFPTPRAADTEGGAVKNVEISEKGSFSRKNKKGVRYGVKLKDAIIHLHKEEEKMLNFPTRTATDAKMHPSLLRKVAKEAAEKNTYRGINLPNHLGMFPKQTEEERKEFLKEKIKTLENLKSKPLKSLKMNPNWIEWLMGYPKKWTDITIESKDLEMQSYHKSHTNLEKE